ncbi:MAG: hypothetical protein ACK4N5_00370 [Myxococcales bacterium]
MSPHLAFAICALLLGCSPPATKLSPPPPGLGLHPFYKKYVDAGGIPILSSEWVPDEALHETARIVERMLAKRPDIRERMVGRQARVAVIGQDEVVTDMPEYRDLYRTFPGTDWNERARGLGGVVGLPLTSTSEENVLCYFRDRYKGESVLVHEFAHGMMNLGLRDDEPEFAPKLEQLLTDAKAAGRWDKTYAATNIDEFWAEAAQSWFDTNLQAEPVNGIHNHVDTCEELEAYDPGLAAMLRDVFPEDFRYRCPGK